MMRWRSWWLAQKDFPVRGPPRYPGLQADPCLTRCLQAATSLRSLPAGADLNIVCQDAAYGTFSEALQAAFADGATSAEEVRSRRPVLGMRHFMTAIENQKKSVKTSELT